MREQVISIIDDDGPTRTALAGLMRARRFAVHAYGSAEEFLDAGVAATSECIITDVQMPGLSGIELKRRLDAERCRTPVIMITARLEQRVHRSAVESGAFCLLLKPFTMDALLTCVDRALAG